ncbi:hypothetical protein SBF1_4860004 [Candidatus Desulfosporosinus infrequens]|uniref:Uncharacterized protein n=1 Tax=Candidatus Desulfosporosinus infrequens TaxID=2043169 RepID=A0A2U3LFT5_9FIRM|nr:hypothetical protein SBF1_4860004 [Candidatus Desulfosporosinus infrequens]
MAAAKIIQFPRSQSLDEEFDDQYERYYADDEDLANSINNSTRWRSSKRHPNAHDRITVGNSYKLDDNQHTQEGYIQFIFLMITVVAILVSCYLIGHF